MEKDNKDATKRGKPDLSATGIVRLATERITLFHTPGRESFARVWVKDHWETHRIKSSSWRAPTGVQKALPREYYVN